MPQRILFVCAGNICRSPLAEGIFLHKLKERGLTAEFTVDSAGTGAWHVGERPDPRSQEVAQRHGVELPGRSRQFLLKDFAEFDLILAMDRANYQDIVGMADKKDLKKIKMMRDYDLPENRGESVPDPYYIGKDSFEVVFQMLDVSCENLLDTLTPPK